MNGTAEGKKLCLSCARVRMAQMKDPTAYPHHDEQHARCEECAHVNEDVKARVYARAAAAVREDRARADSETWNSLPRIDAPIKMEMPKGLRTYTLGGAGDSPRAEDPLPLFPVPCDPALLGTEGDI